MPTGTLNRLPFEPTLFLVAVALLISALMPRLIVFEDRFRFDGQLALSKLQVRVQSASMSALDLCVLSQNQFFSTSRRLTHN
jgi:hypothetical protein